MFCQPKVEFIWEKRKEFFYFLRNYTIEIKSKSLKIQLLATCLVLGLNFAPFPNEFN
jgi:hypothetical protein